MNSPWLELLANLALVAMFVSIWAHAHEWTIRSAWVRAIAFGLLMGLGAVTLMHVPAELFPGVMIDLRSTMIVLAGFFGGPVSGVIAGACAIAYRVVEGGVGVSAGAISIALTTAVGIAGNIMVRNRGIRRIDIVVVGAVASVASLAGLVVLPQEVLEAVLPRVALPSTLLVFVSTVMSGLVLLQEDLRVEALRSKRLYEAVVQALPDCLNVKDLEGRFLAANPATARLMHAPNAEALLGKTDFDFFPEETARRFREDELAAMEDQEALTLEQRVSFEDGGSGWLATLKAPMRDHFGVMIGLITHNRDITQRKALERDLAESRQKLNDALTNMADGLVMFDADGVIELCNQQYRDLFPETADLRVPGMRHRHILVAAAARGEAAPADIELWMEDVLEAQRTDSEREIQLSNGRWLNARTRQMKDGGSLSVFSDITTVKRAERELLIANEKLKLLANRDGLTELLTRRAFDETLEQEFRRSKRSGAPLSLLLLDVDWFKRYNDRYGHPEGDECLRAVSRCLQDWVRRPADSAARYGGEEFAAILPETDTDGAFAIGESVLQAIRALQRPHEASEHKVVTASIGVATLNGFGDTASVAELLRRADEALYGAKAAGRNRVHGWRPRLVEVSREAKSG